jgi:NTE family protein
MESSKKPYKLGIALSGGGARGFAHLGALYALEEMGLKPDIVAGVSAGSIAGSLYGSGLKPLEIMRCFMKMKFWDMCDVTVPRRGFFSMKGFDSFMRENLKVSRLEECPIPTVVCATDIDNCEPVQWREGSITERVVASCSMPVVFRPAIIDGIHYVDGGVLHNLPAWAIRNDVEHLIGINVSPQIKPTDHPVTTIVGIALRSFRIMSRNNSVGDIKLCDTLISVDSVAEMGVFTIKEKERMFKCGYFAAKKALANSPLLSR